jgi:single-strand DNA-binding protein
MFSLNKVVIAGNLGQAPELRYTQSGNAVCNVSIATNETWKDKEGQKQEKTEWHRVTFYGKKAEVVGQWLKKGDPLYVEGRLETREWEDKQGVTRYTTEIIADDMKFMGGKKDEPKRTEQPVRELADADIPF